MGIPRASASMYSLAGTFRSDASTVAPAGSHEKYGWKPTPKGQRATPVFVAEVRTVSPCGVSSYCSRSESEKG